LAQAEEVYRRALAELPDEPVGLIETIKNDFDSYRRQQEQAMPPQWFLAERALAFLVELLPTDEEIQGLLAEICLAQGDYYADQARANGDWTRGIPQVQKLDEAVSAYQRALTAAEHRTQFAPTNPAAWQQLATAQAGLGSLYHLYRDNSKTRSAYDRSLASWQKVTELGADTLFAAEIAAVHVARGILLLRDGDLAAAKQDFLAARELASDDPDWLAEVDDELQAYQQRQQREGIQRQVVAAGELRHELQPDLNWPSNW
jgi:tetratricopeptide (TPR) repeat protein